MSNQLSGETSPYLLQHADNPVNWQPWGEQALAQARNENRPILLSIGYSACHWCHVMAHECFEDEDVAAVMNGLFVNIKVDREERPDLDHIYQTAHQMLTGRPGGWPLTMFLSPDGSPFFAGTYFPKTPRHGLPAFADLCERIAEAWHQRPDAIRDQNQSLAHALASTLPTPGSENAEFRPPIAETVAYLLRSFDSRYGGFGGAPKFPHATELALLLRQPSGSEARDAALLTLRRMADGGLFDQLGGGFFRYSVDERWEIPHFEKMLYDNALLLPVYADAWALTGETQFADVVERTVAWVLREMQLPEGGFASSLDADSEGEEGRFYCWQAGEIRDLLTDDEWGFVSRHWGLNTAPNFENAHWHLHVVGTPSPAETELLESARHKLLDQRDKRVRPGRDDKVLTAWNALMIEGLAHASRVFDRPDWLRAARRAFDFVCTQMIDDGRLLATWRNGRAHLNAYLDDYAFLLAAAIELLQCDFRPADLALAHRLADALLDNFEDREAGGFHFTSHDHEHLIHRPKPMHDNALPSGNAVAMLALMKLASLTDDTRYTESAARAARLFAVALNGHGVGAATLLMAMEEAGNPGPSVILRGPREEVRAWSLELARRPSCRALVLPIADAKADLPSVLDKPISARVNAWVCSGVTCLPPIADLDELRHVLQ